MKKVFAALLALCMLASAPLSLADESTSAPDVSAFGVTVIKTHDQKNGQKQQQDLTYPTFESEDEGLAQFLTDSVTTPILALRKLGQMGESADYADGATDTIRCSYTASLDFQNLLCVAATVSNRAAKAEKAETSLFYRIVDLTSQRVLMVDELFEENADEVAAAIRGVVYAKASVQNVLLESITSEDELPAPNSYFVCADHFRVLYAAGAVNENAMYVDIPWSELGLTASELLLPVQADTADGEPNEATAEGSTDGEPVPQETEAPQATDEPGEYVEDTATPEPTEAPTATPAAPQTLDPNFTLPDVTTPTPMPLEASDEIIVDVLAHGLWKQLGTNGDTYYQFTEDGKLLTVSVSNFIVANGELQSDVLSGTVAIGSDSAFTLRDENGVPEGYVLNRAGEAVAPEEFVTPSPTPVPTPTPEPTSTPSPEPTPEPTPTLSPLAEARGKAPSLAPLADASFEKARTLKVYSAPSEDSFRDSGAQVTTDETVAIYGTVGEWVLVSYRIGNGSKGRVGYIDSMTLNAPESVAKLQFASATLVLAKNANATDDPLGNKGTITSLKKGDEVTLLAFMGDEWAYIETTYKGKPCRLFIPQKALGEE